jgi:hypothetical protein
MAREPVILNVYDMCSINKYTLPLGLKLNTRDAGKLGQQFQFRQSVHVGHTDLTEDDVKRILAERGKDFVVTVIFL